jgi:hypothetical protein
VKVYSNQQVFTALRDQKACPVRIWRIIHNSKTNTKTLFLSSNLNWERKKLRVSGRCAKGREATAPNTGTGLWTVCT